MNYIIEGLTKNHDRTAFDCGEPSLNEFIKNFARRNDAKGIGKTFVAVVPNDVHIKGFYTISSSSVSFESFAENLPRYPIPTIHLGRLGVDQTARNSGLGSLLMFDAFHRSLKLADQLGIYAIEVYALNEAARKFYLKFGFTALKDEKFHLYLPIKFVRKLMQ